MIEKDFQRKCKEDLLSFFPNLHYVKIPDAIRSEKRYRFLPPKPYDAYFVYKGKFVALEYKYKKNLTALPFAYFRQDETLMEVIENKGNAYYCIGIEAKNERGKYKNFYYLGKTRMMFFLNPFRVIKWKEDMRNGIIELKNENSVTVDELLGYSDIIVTRKKKWDFDSVLKSLEANNENT